MTASKKIVCPTTVPKFVPTTAPKSLYRQGSQINEPTPVTRDFFLYPTKSVSLTTTAVVHEKAKTKNMNTHQPAE